MRIKTLHVHFTLGGDRGTPPRAVPNNWDITGTTEGDNARFHAYGITIFDAVQNLQRKYPKLNVDWHYDSIEAQAIDQIVEEYSLD